jgi:hypothetical protein
MRLATAVCAALAAAPAVAAVGPIAPQHGMRGVSLGMSRQRVAAVLGPPLKVTHGSNELGRWTAFQYGGLTVTFAFDRGASQLASTTPSDRTIRGVGVGATPADVARRVTGAKCVHEPGYFHCYVGAWKPGAVVTDFSIRRGRVWRVVVGRVLD